MIPHNSTAAMSAYVFVALVVGMVLTSTVAYAEANATVSGIVRLADPSQRGEPPVRNYGFLQRRPNPLLPTRPYNPLPHVIVVLEPIAVELSPRQSGPPTLVPRWRLVGEAFATPLMPMAINGELEIRNAGSSSHRLYSPTVANLLPGDVLNPKGTRKVRVTQVYTPIEVRDQDSTHLSGHIIAFPLRYTALADDDGKFRVADVPLGKWKLRIWYRKGWLTMKEPEFVVSPRRGATVNLTLPPSLKTNPPAS